MNNRDELIKILHELIGEDIEINDEVGFFDLGISSLTITSLCERINEKFGISCDETDIFNNSNLVELSDYISSKMN